MTMRRFTREEFAQVFDNILGDPLPGATPQGVMEESAVQRHHLGGRLVIPRASAVYRYVHANAVSQLRPETGVFPQVDYQETGTVAVIAALGTRQVSLTAVAAVAVNEYANGILSFGGGGTSGWGDRYRVLGNTVAAAGGAVFVVTLADPLYTGLTLADIATLYHSPWRSRVVSARQRFLDGDVTDARLFTICGVPTRYVQADFFCWIQVKGPCVVMGSAGTEGTAVEERGMQFDNIGALARLRDLGDGLGRHAIAGAVLPVTTGGNQPNGLIGIWLDIPGA